MAISSSALRIFVVTLCFLGVSVLVVAWIPSQFFIASEDYRYVNVQDNWNGINLRNINVTDSWNTTMTHDNGVSGQTFSIGGRNLRLMYHRDMDYVIINHRAGLGLWFEEQMKWYAENGEMRHTATSEYGMKKADLDTDFSSFKKNQYTVKSDWPFQIVVLFWFNNTKYTSPSLAWTGNELQILIGISWEYTSTTMNAWDLISGLLFWHLPNVNIYINALLSIPFWAGIAVFSAIIVMEFIQTLKPFG